MLKKWLLPIGIIVIVVIAVVVFIGAGPKSSTSGPKKVGESSTSSEQAGAETTQSEFKVADKIEFDKRILTVNSVQRNYSSGNEYVTPPEGKEWIVVSVTIENKSNSEISFNEYDFQIENSQGVRTSTTYTGELKDQLNSGNLAVGGKVTGNLVFEVTKGATGLKVIFKPSFWTNKEVKIDL